MALNRYQTFMKQIGIITELYPTSCSWTVEQSGHNRLANPQNSR